MARCGYGVSDTGKSDQRCTETTLENRMYCPRHHQEAMARVAMVSPVDGTATRRWSGVTSGSQIGNKVYARIRHD